MSKLKEFLSLVDEANEIFDSNLPWDTKYDLIFSDDISIRIFNLVDLSEYYDPDTSYEADVTAFIEALNRKAGRT